MMLVRAARGGNGGGGGGDVSGGTRTALNLRKQGEDPGRRERGERAGEGGRKTTMTRGEALGRVP